MTRTPRILVSRLILALVLLAPLAARAAFEDVTIDPRARGMGEASVAVADAPFAVATNPAFLARADRPTLAATYVQPYGLAFARQAFIGAAIPLPGKAGAVGVGMRRFSVTQGAVDLMTELTLSAGYGVVLYDDMHSTITLGGSLNVFHLKFADTVGDWDNEFAGSTDPGNDSSVGVDVGMAVTLHERTHLGFLVHNLNQPNIGIDQEELPQLVKGGVAYEPYTGVITSFEVANHLDHEVQYRGGIEFSVVDGFVLRGGVVTNPGKLTAGFGYTVHGVAVQYGFSTGGGVLDSTHQFGLTFVWGGEAK